MNRPRYWKLACGLVLLLLSVCCPAIGYAADALTNLTGMRDSRYYNYEMRGQSSASVRLSQSLWEGGATEARIAIEKAHLSSSRHQLIDAASSLAFDAVTAHVAVVRQRTLVELAHQNIRDYTKTITLLRSRVSSGLTTPGDISLVESRLFRAEATLAEYQSELLSAKADFEMVTGQPVPLRLASVSIPHRLYKSSAEVIDACRLRNPRLLAEQEGISIARGQEKLARAGDAPKIGLEVGPRWHIQDTPQDSTNHGWDALVTFQWNLYEGGATQAAKRSAAAQKRQARHNLKSVADTLEADILGTWARYQAAAERMRFYEKSMNTARRARGIFYEQYLLGSKTLLDLLDADNEYFLAASQYTVAQADRIIGAYRLLTLGGDILHTLGLSLPDVAEN